jgi:xylan 1,4-beta-xylosidase
VRQPNTRPTTRTPRAARPPAPPAAHFNAPRGTHFNAPSGARFIVPHSACSVVPRVACFVALLLLACLLARASSAQPTYTNPVIAGDNPDPSVVRAGEDYWAVVTSGVWAPHFPVYHSRDLVNWRRAGAVFTARPAWARGDFWAPEIVEDRGRFLVYYTARRDEGARRRGTLCVAVATADAPAGPYTDHGPLVCEMRELKNVGSIDAFFVRDEAGTPHLVWKADGNDAEPDVPTSIFAQPLTEDGLKLTGRRTEILRNDAPWERHVTEGSYIIRRQGWFYHFYSGNACCGRGCDYALGVARSRKLLGTWEKHPANPVLDDNADWQCPGHGSIVTTPDGRDFMLYHSYRRRADTFNVGREALLDEIVWDAHSGWPVINAGRGPTTSARAPLGAAEGDDEAEVFDDFASAALSPEWAWPMPNEQEARAEAAGGGWLRLTTIRSAKPDEWAGAVLARQTVSGSYTAEAAVDLRALAPQARAGLSAFSWRDSAVGVAIGGGKVSVWRREGREQKVLASASAPASPSVRLRMKAARGETYRFAFSTDGRAWTELGGEVGGSHVEGARVALTVGGPPGTSARFDWLRVTPEKR